MTMDIFWPSWRSLGSNWLSVGVSWGVLGRVLGSCLCRLGSFQVALAMKMSSKVLQADIAETCVNTSVLRGLRGWRLPRSRQNGILDVLVAQYGCLE